MFSGPFVIATTNFQIEGGQKVEGMNLVEGAGRPLLAKARSIEPGRTEVVSLGEWLVVWGMRKQGVSSRRAKVMSH